MPGYGFHPDALVEYAEATTYYLIFAVMHCSREPGYWKQRVG